MIFINQSYQKIKLMFLVILYRHDFQTCLTFTRLSLILNFSTMYIFLFEACLLFFLRMILPPKVTYFFLLFFLKFSWYSTETSLLSSAVLSLVTVHHLTCSIYASSFQTPFCIIIIPCVYPLGKLMAPHMQSSSFCLVIFLDISFSVFFFMGGHWNHCSATHSFLLASFF